MKLGQRLRSRLPRGPLLAVAAYGWLEFLRPPAQEQLRAFPSPASVFSPLFPQHESHRQWSRASQGSGQNPEDSQPLSPCL